jgi:hypothetical protein
MENLFDTGIGVALACLLALLGYLGLLFEHPKPERQKKRERIAHRALMLAAVIELACAVATIAAAHGWAPVHHTPAPIVEPERAMGLIAEVFPWMAGSSPAMTNMGDKHREAEPSSLRSV